MIRRYDSLGIGIVRCDGTDEYFLKEVVLELCRARSKFTENKHQLTALNEEVGELNQAMLQKHYSPDKKTSTDVLMEAVQVCAMAIRVGVEGDHTFDYDPDQIDD